MATWVAIAAVIVAIVAILAALGFIGWRARRIGALPPGLTARSAAPPDVAVEWTAEIEWHRGDSRFYVVAGRPGSSERIVVSESEPLPWPPNGPGSVQALARAVEQLESRAVAAGWGPAPAGRAWYAKRFTWQPRRAAPSVAAGRPDRRP
jgi:hypothetical protein